MKKIEQLEVLRAYPNHPGPEVRPDGIVFAAVIKGGKEASLVLTDREGSVLREIALDPSERIGDVASILLKGADPERIWYYYTVEGEKVMDPYCTAIEGGLENGLCRASGGFDWGGEEVSPVSLHDMMIYKLHVRGFTMKDRISPKKRGTFTGVREKLSYIRELGFNTIELMPVYAFDRTLEPTPYTKVSVTTSDEAPQVVEPAPRYNYWGYAAKNFYFAPNPDYASTRNPAAELKELIRTCHREGMSVILEFCFPEKTDPADCLRVLRYWKMHYHVDGFHLIGAGVPVESIASDPFLTKTVLFFERVWEGMLEGNSSAADRRIAEYNADFQNAGRSLLKGDEGTAGVFSRFLRRNPADHACVNYMANVNGFTLYDSVCYDWKHNEDNGEANRDGTDHNLSWNCGVEGPSKKKQVRELRLRQVKNALSYVFLSSGIPLLMAGDECMNSQGGNNNPYASDDETGWVNWNRTKEAEEIREFVKRMTSIRRDHPILHPEKELKGTDRRSCGYPEISFHDTKAWVFSPENAARTLAVLFVGLYTLKEDAGPEDFVYAAFNGFWENHPFAMPALPKGMNWEKILDTALSEKDGSKLVDEDKFCQVGARSVSIYQGVRSPKQAKAARPKSEKGKPEQKRAEKNQSEESES